MKPRRQRQGREAPRLFDWAWPELRRALRRRWLPAWLLERLPR